MIAEKVLKYMRQQLLAERALQFYKLG